KLRSSICFPVCPRKRTWLVITALGRRARCGADRRGQSGAVSGTFLCMPVGLVTVSVLRDEIQVGRYPSVLEALQALKLEPQRGDRNQRGLQCAPIPLQY